MFFNTSQASRRPCKHGRRRTEAERGEAGAEKRRHQEKKSQPWKVKKNSSISQVWVLMHEKKLRCGAAAALTWFHWPTVVIYCSSLSSRPERFVSPEAALKAV